MDEEVKTEPVSEIQPEPVKEFTEEEKQAQLAVLKKKARRPAIKPKKGRPRKHSISKYDFLKTMEVPRVVSWRKIRLWIRDRRATGGETIEARILSVELHTQRNICKAYCLDPKFTKDNLRDTIFKGFKCCMCNRSWQLNSDWELEQIQSAPEYEGANILCGKCWCRGSE